MSFGLPPLSAGLEPRFPALLDSPSDLILSVGHPALQHFPSDLILSVGHPALLHSPSDLILSVGHPALLHSPSDLILSVGHKPDIRRACRGDLSRRSFLTSIALATEVNEDGSL
jgi:hypothetical protein